MKIIIDRKPENAIPENLLEAEKSTPSKGGLSIYPATGPYSNNLIMIFGNGAHVCTFSIEDDGSPSLANAEPVTGLDRLGTIRPYKITGPAFTEFTLR